MQKKPEILVPETNGDHTNPYESPTAEPTITTAELVEQNVAHRSFRNRFGSYVVVSLISAVMILASADCVRRTLRIRVHIDLRSLTDKQFEELQKHIDAEAKRREDEKANEIEAGVNHIAEDDDNVME